MRLRRGEEETTTVNDTIERHDRHILSAGAGRNIDPDFAPSQRPR
jgi:hypothetical protein